MNTALRKLLSMLSLLLPTLHAQAQSKHPFIELPDSDVSMSAYETTRSQFAEFVKATDYDATGDMYSLRPDAFDWAPNGDTWMDPGYPQTNDHPVVGVSLFDARAYCRWLTEESAKSDPRFGSELEYRLPTDAEWSLAMGIVEQDNTTPETRMRSAKTAYPWGQHWPPPVGYGNFAGTESAKGKPSWWGTIPGGYTDLHTRTSPVGSYPSSALGFYDLSGNVWEWIDTTYTADSEAYVLRGGCWGSDRPAYLLVAKRNPAFPEMRNDEAGFRIVLAPRD